MKHLFLVLFILGISITVYAVPSGPDNRYNIIHDFQKDWIEYNPNLKVFTPFIAENGNSKKAYSLQINFNDYPGAYLLIKTETEGNYLFFDNSLKKTLKKDEWVIFKLYDLVNELKKSENTLSIYGNGNPENNKVFIGYPTNTSSKKLEKSSSSYLNLFPRNSSLFNSGLVIVFLVNIIMLSFISNNYSKAFRKYYSFKDLTAFIPKENSFLINKPMDRPNMMFVILLSLITGFIIILSQTNGLNLFKENFLFQTGNTFGITTTNFFKISLLVFISFLLKFFYLNLIGKLFNIEKVIDIHFFKIIQSSLYFFTGALIVLLICFNSFINLQENFKTIFAISLVIFYILRTTLIYFTIIRSGNIKTLYLISYLCIVEGFPIVLGLRIFL
ncbi:DUF4271 domain-containing protein [Lacihabitans sp. LS3-19]|uniref:DUF4271 domain-containing protein n=1 Tax=Lacihabitans sp. LS3-19 TaxID=2487335 RepID=UPI0020CD315A|nr:DUF4271 domain-containing protein [Lacihabitans sp. LS3-19]MCP9770084.1 DUF4271 domain-containing protein [Lacihabitans sp. LS3-19]